MAEFKFLHGAFPFIISIVNNRIGGLEVLSATLFGDKSDSTPHTISDQGLDHVVLRVKDIESMLTFYCDVLKLPIKKHNKALGIWHLEAGASMIDLLEVSCSGNANIEPSSGKVRNVDHFALKIEPFEESKLRSYFENLGLEVRPAESRFGADGDGPSVYLIDPEGNVVELKGRA